MSSERSSCNQRAINTDGVLYVTTRAGTIQAYDVATHALLWTSPQTGSGESGPAVVNGVLYAGGDNGVYAFAPSP